MTQASNIGRMAYEARFRTWPKGLVPDFDRLPQSQQDIWNEVAETVAAPMVAALHNALEQMAFASAALDGAGQVRHGLIAENKRLREGLVGALDTMERCEVFVTSKEQVKYPEGFELWTQRLRNARTALVPPTAEEVAKVASLQREGYHGDQIRGA